MSSTSDTKQDVPQMTRLEEDVPQGEDVPQMTRLEEDVPQATRIEDVPQATRLEDVPHVTRQEDIPQVTRLEDVPHVSRQEDVPQVTRQEDVPQVTDNATSDGEDGTQGANGDKEDIKVETPSKLSSNSKQQKAKIRQLMEKVCYAFTPQIQSHHLPLFPSLSSNPAKGLRAPKTNV